MKLPGLGRVPGHPRRPPQRGDMLTGAQNTLMRTAAAVIDVDPVFVQSGYEQTATPGIST